MIKKEELVKLIDKYDRQAEKAYMNYQETGTQRYDRERRNAEDLADALRVALGAADEHTAYINLRTNVAILASKVERLRDTIAASPSENVLDEVGAILGDIVAIASVSCGYGR